MRAQPLIMTMIAIGLAPIGAASVWGESAPPASASASQDVSEPAAASAPALAPLDSAAAALDPTKTPLPAAAVSEAATQPPPTVTASLAVPDHVSKEVAANAATVDDAIASWELAYLDLQPVLANSCASCHTDEEAEGDFRLEDLHRDGQVRIDRTQARTLARVLTQHEMPPEGSDELLAHDRDRLVAWLTSRPVREGDCNQIASDESAPWYRGYVMSRRLTRSEYNNCIRDLTGLDYLRSLNDFPADGAGGEGFDTHGATLFTSPILMEKLLAAADRTIEEAVPDTELGVSSERLHARRKILTATPSDTLPEPDAARQILHTFAERAWRRPAKADEVDRLVELYAARREAGANFVPAIKMPLKAVLLSPNFLFVAEQAPERGDDVPRSVVRRISGPEMAQRLAMFLWSTMPDERLRTLAQSDAIFEPETLRREVRRMLRDDRSRGLAENFGLQWLGLTELTSMLRPDAERFPEFDLDLAIAMREEAVRLVLCVLNEDRSALDLIDAPFTFVNPRLARHYGMPLAQAVAGVAEGDFARVPVASGRGGVVTLAGVLATTSYPHRTSPVLRGQWILDTILGSPVAAPPEDVPPIDESVADAASLRERLAAHRTNAACAACHAKMDPLGFGLESFDAIGRIRSERVDDSGELPDGTRFEGPDQLKQLLLDRRDEFAGHLCRKLLGYAMGRELNEFDDCTIDRATQAMRRSDYRIGVAIEEIAVSYAFQHRYFKR